MGSDSMASVSSMALPLSQQPTASSEFDNQPTIPLDLETNNLPEGSHETSRCPTLADSQTNTLTSSYRLLWSQKQWQSINQSINQSIKVLSMPTQQTQLISKFQKTNDDFNSKSHQQQNAWRCRDGDL